MKTTRHEIHRMDVILLQAIADRATAAGFTVVSTDPEVWEISYEGEVVARLHIDPANERATIAYQYADTSFETPWGGTAVAAKLRGVTGWETCQSCGIEWDLLPPWHVVIKDEMQPVGWRCFDETRPGR